MCEPKGKEGGRMCGCNERTLKSNRLFSSPRKALTFKGTRRNLILGKKWRSNRRSPFYFHGKLRFRPAGSE
jgi:hypothetical protein